MSDTCRRAWDGNCYYVDNPEVSMKHIRQPEGSSLCGQACLAMYLDIPLEESIRLFGSRGGTRTPQLVRILRSFEISCPDRLVRRTCAAPLPLNCITKSCSPDRKHSHWMLYSNGILYDPCAREAGYCNAPGWEITSYLPLESPFDRMPADNYSTSYK
jgi:hypothetical protein